MNAHKAIVNLKAALKRAGRGATVRVNHVISVVRPTTTVVAFVPAMLVSNGLLGLFGALEFTKPSMSSSVGSSQNWQICSTYEDQLKPGGVSA